MPTDDRESESDAALWLEAVSGSGASFAAIYDRHRRRVFRKAYGITLHIDDAEDVVAMVFLEAWQKRDRVRIVEGSLLPWLLTTTTYVTLNQERAKRRHRIALAQLPSAPERADWTDDVDEDLDRRHRWGGMRAALARLGRADQLVLQLCLVDQLSLQEVADVLQVPMGTVKSRLSRARARLRTELRRAGVTADEGLLYDGDEG